MLALLLQNWDIIKNSVKLLEWSMINWQTGPDTELTPPDLDTSLSSLSGHGGTGLRLARAVVAVTDNITPLIPAHPLSHTYSTMSTKRNHLDSKWNFKKCCKCQEMNCYVI